ncbi:MAG: hypothetical protein NTV23_04140 [Propionibacteriales bacterium]|nr:hypothetical protein [Propionibacteriales bacterium]
MSRNQAPDLSKQIGQQRDRLAETVGGLTDKIDVGAITDKIDVSGLVEKLDTDALRTRAESSAATLLENATDSEGRPRRGLLVGLVLGVVALVLVRRVLK